ncbi:TPA: hypothetical protein RVR55_000318 [Aeromonas dhakensis]|nr:hypothetical protein [Aeromonas dhakensis]
MSRTLKLHLLTMLQQELRRMCELAIAGAHEAQQEANYHIGAMESRYDTFKEEAQYLTEAQKLRLLTLQGQLQECVRLHNLLAKQQRPYQHIQLGAFITLLEEGQERVQLFIAPANLGKPHECTQGKIICITPDTPVVSPAMGLTVGEEYQVCIGDSIRNYDIIAIE